MATMQQEIVINIAHQHSSKPSISHTHICTALHHMLQMADANDGDVSKGYAEMGSKGGSVTGDDAQTK